MSRVIRAENAPPLAGFKAWDVDERAVAHAASAAHGHHVVGAGVEPLRATRPDQPLSIRDAPFDALWATYSRRGRAEFLERLGGSAAAALLASPAAGDSSARLCAAFNAAGFPWPAGAHADARGARVSVDARDAARALRARLGEPRPVPLDAGARSLLGRAGILLFEGLPDGAAALELWRVRETASVLGERFGEARAACFWEVR